MSVSLSWQIVRESLEIKLSPRRSLGQLVVGAAHGDFQALNENACFTS